MARKIRVLVAHGSVVEREKMIALLGADPEVQVVGEIARSVGVIDLTRRLAPDVIALGAGLPGEGGLATTKEIMIEAPTPVVIVSDDEDSGQVQSSILALRAGALAVVARPSAERNGTALPSGQHFVATIKAMAGVKVIRHWREPGSRAAAMQKPRLDATPGAMGEAIPHVVAIAASTGGPAALQQILGELPADFSAPILVVQHIASGFAEGLAASLNSNCALKVKLALQGEPLLPGTIYVGPDGSHLGVGDRTRILLSAAAPIGGFRPSASHLFESVAKAFGAASLHVILTGMGQDGLTGLKAAHASGARIFAQDEASSVVFGMPGVAVAAGIADEVLPLSSIAGEIMATMQESLIVPR